MKTILIAAVALLLTACSSSDKKSTPKYTLIPDIDLSGTLHHLGGMLINDHQLIHVTHWPTKEGQKVFFVGKDKKRVYRNIAKIEDLGNDLCILSLDKPVDLNNHTIYPVAKPVIGANTTVLRFEDRPRRATVVQAYSAKGRAKVALNKNTLLVGGDSGKAWIQIQNGKKVCVGLNSTTYGYGPPVWDLLLNWVNNKKVAADAEVLPEVVVTNTRLYPKHWGDPPKIQTKDYRKLPEPYGHGSSTLYKWIEKNQKADKEL